jgi:hypothetical protein
MSDTNALRPFAFVLAVPNVEHSATYFRDVLGFRIFVGVLSLTRSRALNDDFALFVRLPAACLIEAMLEYAAGVRPTPSGSGWSACESL